MAGEQLAAAIARLRVHREAMADLAAQVAEERQQKLDASSHDIVEGQTEEEDE